MSIIRFMLLFAMLLTASVGALADPVDINTADADSLAAGIDGVGTQKAMAIIKYREANGPFSSVEELANVQGIGMKTVDRNRSNLSVAKPSE